MNSYNTRNQKLSKSLTHLMSPSRHSDRIVVDHAGTDRPLVIGCSWSSH
jgi:hypothetical protein